MSPPYLTSTQIILVKHQKNKCIQIYSQMYTIYKNSYTERTSASLACCAGETTGYFVWLHQAITWTNTDL